MSLTSLLVMIALPTIKKVLDNRNVLLIRPLDAPRLRKSFCSIFALGKI